MTEQEKQDFVGRNLIITCEGHRLSIRNTCLLLFQCQEFTPTQIGGFRQWKKIGRQVKKGSQAIGCIMVPMIKKKKETSETEDINFRYVSVFDVSQTESIAETVAA